MSQVIVIKNSLKITNNLCDIFEKRDVTVIKAGTDNSKSDFFGIDLKSKMSVRADQFWASNFNKQELQKLSRKYLKARRI